MKIALYLSGRIQNTKKIILSKQYFFPYNINLMIFHYSISSYNFTGSKSEVMTIQHMSYMCILKSNTYYIWNFRGKIRN
jgi:hypothetical protein